MASHTAPPPGRRMSARADAIAACALTIAMSLVVSACMSGDRAGDADTATPSAAAAPDVALAAPGAVKDSAGRAVPAPSGTAGDSAASSKASTTAAKDTTAAENARTSPRPTATRTTSVSAGTVKLRATTPAARVTPPVARDTARAADVPTAPATQAAPPASQRDSLAVTPAEYNGWKTFAVNCTRCHGEDAIGSALAPSLVQSLSGALTHDAFVQTVMEGRLEKGMPPWRALLSDAQVEQLYAYLKARAEGRLAPGRPHVRQAQD